MNTQLKPIPELDNLPDDKREQLHEWIETLGYIKTMAKLKDEWGLEITYNKIYRYYHRHLDKADLDQALEDELTVPQYLDLLNGRSIPYDKAGIQRIMRRAYHLVGEHGHSPTKLATLLRILHYSQNRDWTNKRIEISDRLARVREQQLALSSSKKPSDQNPHSAFRDPQSKFTLWTAEDLIHNQPKVEAAFRAHPFLSQIGLPPDETPPANPNSPSPDSTSPASVGTTSTSSQISNTALDNSAAPNAPAPINTGIHPGAPTAPDNSAVSTASPECQMENPHSALASPARTRIPQSDGSGDPLPTTNLAVSTASSPDYPHSAIRIPQSLEARVTEYTLSRIEEADCGKDISLVGRYAARNFTSKLQWCPCGQDLPCPQHGEFPSHFWELHPDRADYWDILRLKGLPPTPPHIVHKQREDRERHTRFLEWKKNNLATLEGQSKTYAISKWRAFTPRPPQTPAPSDQWRDYCPCGAKFPCEHHPDLYRELLYLKPWNNDYTAALQQHAIPVYTPAQSEIQFWVEQNPNLNPNLNLDPNPASPSPDATSQTSVGTTSTSSQISNTAL